MYVVFQNVIVRQLDLVTCDFLLSVAMMGRSFVASYQSDTGAMVTPHSAKHCRRFIVISAREMRDAKRGAARRERRATRQQLRCLVDADEAVLVPRRAPVGRIS